MCLLQSLSQLCSGHNENELKNNGKGNKFNSLSEEYPVTQGINWISRTPDHFLPKSQTVAHNKERDWIFCWYRNGIFFFFNSWKGSLGLIAGPANELWVCLGHDHSRHSQGNIPNIPTISLCTLWMRADHRAQRSAQSSLVGALLCHLLFLNKSTTSARCDFAQRVELKRCVLLGCVVLVVKLLLSSFINLKNKPWSTRCFFCLGFVVQQTGKGVLVGRSH